jgi:hypothetical protein
MVAGGIWPIGFVVCTVNAREELQLKLAAQPLPTQPKESNFSQALKYR